MKLSKRKTVFVALSGGVDSAVSALLLKKQGFNVVGVYMKNWSGDDYGLQDDCPYKQDLKDVEKIAKNLNIPYRVYNFEKEYYQKVIEYFFSEYSKGRTPNPDVMCNKEIKFSLFLDKALEDGADFIATGHYVRKESKEINDKIVFNLLKGVDENKDQSYFLYLITQNQLKKSFFPIGNLTKRKVRNIAKDNNISVADKPDSQGICFVGEINVQDFLRQKIKSHLGDIIDIETGEKKGVHDGVEFFTIGQREGLKIGGAKEPYYVVKKDYQKNILYVAMGRNNKYLFNNKVFLEDFHLIRDDLDTNYILNSSNLKASIRYRHNPEKVKLSKFKDKLLAEFEKPQRAVTPGQSLVVYEGDVCLGGGVICDINF